jgi:hypothetical protein
MKQTDLPTVVATLRYAANTLWPSSPDDAGWMRSVADVLEEGGDAIEMCCPLCEETLCDDACPVRPHREVNRLQSA